MYMKSRTCQQTLPSSSQAPVCSWPSEWFINALNFNPSVVVFFQLWTKCPSAADQTAKEILSSLTKRLRTPPCQCPLQLTAPPRCRGLKVEPSWDTQVCFVGIAKRMQQVCVRVFVHTRWRRAHIYSEVLLFWEACKSWHRQRISSKRSVYWSVEGHSKAIAFLYTLGKTIHFSQTQIISGRTPFAGGRLAIYQSRLAIMLLNVGFCLLNYGVGQWEVYYFFSCPFVHADFCKSFDFTNCGWSDSEPHPFVSVWSEKLQLSKVLTGFFFRQHLSNKYTLFCS